MAGSAARVVVTERQFAILDEFRRSRSEPRWVVQRAAVIVLGFEKWSNQEIAAEVGLDRMAVGLWRAAWEELTLWECTQPQRLREAIRETLRDARWAALGLSGDDHR